jgi:hypothetical protein
MKKQKLGDCIVVACNNVIENNDWLFCYSYVMGQGELKGKRILHAWNEINGFVLDFSNNHNIIVRKEIYYRIAEIEEKDVVKQNSDEVRKLLVETGKYGGWIKDNSQQNSEMVAIPGNTCSSGSADSSPVADDN